MKVELVYATVDAVSAEELDLPDGTTLDEAVKASRFASTPAAAYAIFGKIATAERVLEEGDRIEVLRDLVVDPKDARRHRATNDGVDGDNP